MKCSCIKLLTKGLNYNSLYQQMKKIFLFSSGPKHTKTEADTEIFQRGVSLIKIKACDSAQNLFTMPIN